MSDALGYIGDFILAGFHAIGFFALCGFASMFGLLENQSQTSGAQIINVNLSLI